MKNLSDLTAYINGFTAPASTVTAATPPAATTAAAAASANTTSINSNSEFESDEELSEIWHSKFPCNIISTLQRSCALSQPKSDLKFIRSKKDSIIFGNVESKYFHEITVFLKEATNHHLIIEAKLVQHNDSPTSFPWFKVKILFPLSIRENVIKHLSKLKARKIIFDYSNNDDFERATTGGYSNNDDFERVTADDYSNYTDFERAIAGYPSNDDDHGEATAGDYSNNDGDDEAAADYHSDNDAYEKTTAAEHTQSEANPQKLLLSTEAQVASHGHGGAPQSSGSSMVRRNMTNTAGATNVVNTNSLPELIP